MVARNYLIETMEAPLIRNEKGADFLLALSGRRSRCLDGTEKTNLTVSRNKLSDRMEEHGIRQQVVLMRPLCLLSGGEFAPMTL